MLLGSLWRTSRRKRRLSTECASRGPHGQRNNCAPWRNIPHEGSFREPSCVLRRFRQSTGVGHPSGCDFYKTDMSKNGQKRAALIWLRFPVAKHRMADLRISCLYIQYLLTLASAFFGFGWSDWLLIHWS